MEGQGWFTLGAPRVSLGHEPGPPAPPPPPAGNSQEGKETDLFSPRLAGAWEGGSNRYTWR